MRKKNPKLLNISIIVIIGLIVFFAIIILYRLNAYQVAEKTYSSIKESAVIDIDDNSTANREIDFKFLNDINPVINSWIYIPGTEIDYPVVQGIDNSTFLDCDVNGSKSVAGSIFISCDNSTDFTDYKTVIYGHSMKDGSMFHELHNYSDASFAAEHDTLFLYLNSGEIKQYKLLCTLKADAYDEDLYLYDKNNTANDSMSYIQTIQDESFNKYSGNNIVLLSTCIRGNLRRVVVFEET